MSPRRTCRGGWNPHAALAEAPGGLLGQLVGLPAPPGHAVFVPKYKVCGEGGPWRRPGARLCRVIIEYGPRGVAGALAKAGLPQAHDPAYAAPIPYVSCDSLSVICPPEALMDALSRGVNDVVAVAGLLADQGVPLESLGLTGSNALGAAVPGLSDVDLIVYSDSDGSEAVDVARIFSSLTPAGPPRSDFGGVRVYPPAGVGWRRARVAGVTASWVGVPRRGISAHCKPLSSYPPRDPPRPQARVSLRVSVRPGQPEALLYPPCVDAGAGLTLVSLEYNLALVLYTGGVFKISGIASESGGTVYLGLREEPGYLKRL